MAALSASDLQTVYSLLGNSLSPDESLRRPAESSLSQAELRPGFCSCLLEIIVAKDLVSQVDVRLNAALYFKNCINRYWRRRRDSFGISNDEKMHLRKKILLHMGEENIQIALQLAVLIAKIARIDYPKEWPDLFSVLAQILQSGDILTSHRVFMVLFRILKELSSKRLSSDQRNFSEIASQFFEYSWHLWHVDVQTILRTFSTITQHFAVGVSAKEQDDLYLTCERWLLCSKIIRQLVISGYPSDMASVQEVRPVKEVCPMMLNAIRSFLPYYSTFHDGLPKFWQFTKRACIKLMKILISIQSRHPYSFGDKSVLQPVMDFCLTEIISPEPAVISFEQLLIQCMVIVKSIVECKEYKPRLTGRVVGENANNVEQIKKNIAFLVGDTLASVLPNERVISLCTILIRRYFVLSESDLNEWFQNPESFHHEQDMVQWTEKMRPCAEALYIVLFENERQLLGPVVVSILRETMTDCPAFETEINPKMLLKDAAYTAAGHVYYELSNFLNFREWFTGTLSQELSNEHPNMRVIHRKIAIVLGQWQPEIKDDLKKLVYFALIKLLEEDDIAVRLAACRSLRFLVEDANFCESDFSELLPKCWNLSFKLVEEIQEFDSKVQVLSFISVLIEHVGEKIISFSTKLVEYFNRSWEESTGESLLQIQLLEALKKFVNALGYQSPICYNMLLPILRRGINIDDPDALNLLEDSVLLWEAILSHAPSMVPELLELFPSLVLMMERSFDHLTVAISILEDYIILGGADFLNRHASSVARILDGIVGNVNNKGLLSTFPIIDVLIQCFPVEAPPLIGGVLQKLIVLCLSGGEEHDPSKTAVRATSGAILARLLVMNTNYLAHLLSEPSVTLALQQAGISTDQNIILYLIDIWIDKVDNVTILQKKTYALALSLILTLRIPQVIDKLDYILSVCMSVLLGESEETNEDDSSDKTDSMGQHNAYGFGHLSSVELKKKHIKDADPIRHLSLEDTLKENLQACAAFHGEALFNEAISRIHPSALAQLQQALKMT